MHICCRLDAKLYKRYETSHHSEQYCMSAGKITFFMSKNNTFQIIHSPSAILFSWTFRM